MEELNATVFSKSFKAPSAWAEREVKYKAERRDWEAKEARLRDAIGKLEAENARYRADNKAAEFEARIQVRWGSGCSQASSCKYNMATLREMRWVGLQVS